MKLSKNFRLEELTASCTAANKGIDNVPGGEEIRNLRVLCEEVLQPARDKVGAIFVSSGFRSAALNRLIGGSKNSQHCKGQAADVRCRDNAALFEFIREHLPFDQLIWEFGDDVQPQWVHVSFSRTKNRGQVLRAFRENGRVRYVAFLKQLNNFYK